MHLARTKRGKAAGSSGGACANAGVVDVSCPGRGRDESALGDVLVLGVPPSDLGDLDLPSSPLSEGRFCDLWPTDCKDRIDQSEPFGSVIVFIRYEVLATVLTDLINWNNEGRYESKVMLSFPGAAPTLKRAELPHKRYVICEAVPCIPFNRIQQREVYNCTRYQLPISSLFSLDELAQAPVRSRVNARRRATPRALLDWYEY